MIEKTSLCYVDFNISLFCRFQPSKSIGKLSCTNSSLSMNPKASHSTRKGLGEYGVSNTRVDEITSFHVTKYSSALVLHSKTFFFNKFDRDVVNFS